MYEQNGDGKMLNRFVWGTYLKSGGNEIVEFFRKNLSEEYTEDYAIQICRMVSKYCPMESELDALEFELKRICTVEPHEQEDENFIEQEHTDVDAPDDELEEYDFIDALMSSEYDCICDIIENDYHAKPSSQNVFRLFISALPETSTMYCMDYPDLFVPYYFQYTFNVLQLIADQFEISLPQIPAKKDYEERFFFYGDICRALTEFRINNDMSPYELCAFLYDFAPNYIGGYKSYIIEDLPEPKGAYFIGGAKTDQELADKSDTITAWQCNEDTRAGDMVIMYLRTPISAVNSVWRACSVGFIDPFFYYYRCTYISKPVKVGSVTQAKMKSDPVIGKLPIVKKNMQGINGVELLPSEYNRLMDLADADVFRFEREQNPQADIKREKDVEDKLIKPLLHRLHYTDSDYVQQLYIEIGNHNHALIPDFVLFPHQSKGHYSAFAIIEAKKSIPNDKYSEVTKTQARSYSKLLNTQYSVIASQEGVWVTSKKDDYSDSIYMSTWQELTDADTFFKLEKLIGRH